MSASCWFERASARGEVEALVRSVATRFELDGARISRAGGRHRVELDVEDVEPGVGVQAVSELREQINRLDQRLRRRGQGGAEVRAAVAESRTFAHRLLGSAAANDIVLDARVKSAVPRAVTDHAEEGGFRLHGIATPPPHRSGAKAALDAFTALGGVAALVAWIAVVGGATMWARYRAAGIPAIETVAVIPRGTLITQGLRTLLLPLVVAALVAGALQLALTPWARKTVPKAFHYWNRDAGLAALIVPFGMAASALLLARAWGAGWLLAGLVSGALLVLLLVVAAIAWSWVNLKASHLTAIIVALLLLDLAGLLSTRVKLWWGISIFVIAVLGIAALLLLLAEVALGARPTRFVGVAVFALAAIWIGVLVTLREAGSKTPRLPVALVRLKPSQEATPGPSSPSAGSAGTASATSPGIPGLFLYRVDNAVFIGRPSKSGHCGIEMIPMDDVANVLVGANAVDALPEKTDGTGKTFEKDTCRERQASGSNSEASSTNTGGPTTTAGPPTTTTNGTTTDTTTTTATTTTTTPPTSSSPTSHEEATTQLAISTFRFSPDPTGTAGTRATFCVTDANGKPVPHALVSVLSLAYSRRRATWHPAENDGSVTVRIPVTPARKLRNRGHIVVLVRAISDGASGRRLFRFRVRRGLAAPHAQHTPRERSICKAP